MYMYYIFFKNVCQCPFIMFVQFEKQNFQLTKQIWIIVAEYEIINVKVLNQYVQILAIMRILHRIQNVNRAKQITIISVFTH